MGLRYSRRIKLGSGVSLNLGKRSASVSIGGRHSRVTIGSRGTHASTSISGAGISYRTGGNRRRGKAKPQGGSALVGFVAFGLIVWFLLHLAGIV